MLLCSSKKRWPAFGKLRCVGAALLCCAVVGLPITTHAAGFPGINRTIPGFGYYGIDTGYDSKFRVYGTVDGFVDQYHSENHSGGRLEGGAAWTNKLGVYWRQALSDDTVIEAIVEEGFNLNGKALDQNWKQIGSLRYAALTLRNRHWGKLDYGKTVNVATPAFADPFYATIGSPYTYLTGMPSGPGWLRLDVRPKHTLAYTSPRFNGFSAAAAMSFGFDDAAHSYDGETVRGKGVRVQYHSPSIIAMASYNDYLSDPWNNGTSFVQTHNIYKSASVFYDFGPLSSNLTWQRQEVRLAVTPTVDNWTWGVMLPVGERDLARLSLTYRDVDAPQRNATGISVGYDHFLREHLAVYARVSMIDNQKFSAMSYAGIPITPGIGDEVSSIAIGLYWHFGVGR